MTRILAMEMKGFKSFAMRTEIQFGEKFNCVLGPNGSGKSNVLDSLCFVLGKSGAKSMRAEKSSNLIYNGGKRKTPAKSGEVSIWFSNPTLPDKPDKREFPIPDESIKITRVVKSSGQSVYKINDEITTRTSILETLNHANINPDGYNIILQGDIVRMVEMSGNERREIIEEISAISIYEEKKQKALRELEKVENALNEADIILAERETYLKELRKERDQAMKFKDLDEKIKRNKATELNMRIKDREEKRDKLQAKVDTATEKIKKIQKEIDEQKDVIAKKKDEVDKINKEVEQRGEKEQVELNRQIEQLKIEIAEDKMRNDGFKKEIERVNERRVQLKESNKELLDKLDRTKKEIETINKQISNREKDLKSIEAKIEDFRKKNNMESAKEFDEKISAIDKEADELQDKIAKLREQQQNVMRDKDKAEITLQSIDEKIEKVLALKKENESQIKELKEKKAAFKDATNNLSKLLNEDGSLTSQLATARTKLSQRREELVKLEHRSMGLRERIAGGMAIEKVLELRKTRGGIHGTVSELGQVKSKFTQALEVAAGGKIKSIVVDDDQVASDCISFLKKSRVGVATFLPINKVRSPVISDEIRKLAGSNGVHGLAIDLISYQSKFKNIFSYVFGDTLVVDDVNVARRIGIGKARMATLDGDIIERSGAMTGGFRKKKESGLGFQEKELTEDIDKLNAEVNDHQKVVTSLENRKEEITESIVKLRETKSELEGDIIKLEKSLHLDSADVDVSEKQKKELEDTVKKSDDSFDKLTTEISDTNRRLAQLKMEKQQIRDKINELRNPRLLAELNAFEQKRNDLREETAVLKTEIKNHQGQIDSVLGPEEENIKKILDQLDKEESQFKNEIEKLKTKNTKNNEDLKEKEKAAQAFYKQFKELFGKRNKLTDEIQDADKDVIRKEEEIRTHEHQSNTISLDLATLKAELAGFYEENKQYEGVELFKTKKLDDIRAEIREFEKMMENIGAVNMKALEIYEQVEEEYKSLITKKETLSGEREDVLVMINEVDSKKKDLFMKTYDEVKKHFERIFLSLSTKGEAFLELENEEDPFEGGVNIKVRITGKKFLDIRGLSGGEKTMTALAFLFAIQEFEPASFYILDEVDAALDKKNSETLAKLIRSYCGHAQYIIISHNDGVITEADNLYGVSMNADGMSKVTSLKV